MHRESLPTPDLPSPSSGDTTTHPARGSIAASLGPRVRLAKKLIVCCDGTWMDSDNGWEPGSWGSSGHLQNPSNVTRIARAVASEDEGHHPQICYYQAGVGTGVGLYDQLLGGGTGLGLSENIREAYAFIANNYAEHDPLVEPDSIFLVGFSRGAFTARSIGGLIGAIGVLSRNAMPHFYEIFKDWENAGNKDWEPMFFKNYFKYSRDVDKCSPPRELAHDKTRIQDYMESYRGYLEDLKLTQKAQVKCVGVFDTVGALGIPINPVLQRIFPFLPSFIREYKWFDTKLDNHIENAFHALALDERRYPFSPALWEKQDGCTTNLKQVWFPGAHSNVGGSVSDYGMADITLAWMMDQLAGNTRDPHKEYKDLDWIKFDNNLIEHFYDLRVQYYKRNDCFRSWGLGKIYDSLAFPVSLMGSRIRSPGGYHATNYETGSPKPRVLKNTQEYIHASARVRMDLGGNAVEPEPRHIFPRGLSFKPLFHFFWRKLRAQPFPSYQPQRQGGPLDGWTLIDGHRSHTKPNMNIDTDDKRAIRWVYEGTDPDSKGKIMMEDKLGDFERRMLQKDKPVAHKIEVSNNGRFGILRRLDHEWHHGRTF